MLREKIWAFIKPCCDYIENFGLGQFLAVIIFAVAFAVALVYGCLVTYRGIRTFLNRDRGRAVAVASAVQSVVGLCVLLAIVLTGIRFLYGPYYISGLGKTAAEERPEPNRDALLVLQSEEEWKALDAESRLEVLQVLVDAEREELGILRPVTIRTEALEGLWGDYQDNTSLIRINSEHLMTSPAKSVAQTVCHEMYHCYEHRLVEVFAGAEPQNRDLAIFGSAADYHWELTGNRYISAKEDPEGYASQACEHDARCYASTEVEKYFG